MVVVKVWNGTYWASHCVRRRWDQVLLLTVFRNSGAGHSSPWYIWHYIGEYKYIFFFSFFLIPFYYHTHPGPNENLDNFLCLSSISLKLPQLYVPSSLVTASNNWNGTKTRLEHRETNSRCVSKEGKWGLFDLASVPPARTSGRKAEAPECLHGK